jgi:hypothetical protein
MQIKITRRTLKTLRILSQVAALVLALVGLYALGDYLTPRGSDGRPLILSPSVRSAEAYRRAVLSWVDEMRAVDAGLERTLSQDEIVDSAQLYALSGDAQGLVERAAAVVGDAAFTYPPPALIGLAQEVQAATSAYLEAARAAALWVGSPEAEALQAARERLQQAREIRIQLESSRWLNDGRGSETTSR